MNQHFVIGIVLLSSFSAAAGAGDGTKTDSFKLQGTWNVVKASVNGKEIGGDAVKDTMFVFKGDVVTFKSPQETNSASFTYDPSKNPRHLTTTVLDGKAKGETRLAIYELSGDKLKMCWTRGTTRPNTFETKEGDMYILLEMVRAKE